MPTNEKLFVYGTLRYAAVERTTFGRTLRAATDTLPGYKISMVTVQDARVIALSKETHHPILHYTGKPTDIINGMVLDITLEELAQAVSYEVDLYKRSRVKLKSGDESWAYVSVVDGTKPD